MITLLEKSLVNIKRHYYASPEESQPVINRKSNDPAANRSFKATLNNLQNMLLVGNLAI